MAGSGSKAANNMPWVEKYRPTKIEDIVGNKEAVGRLEAIAQTGNMPNLIFTAGRCKLTLAFESTRFQSLIVKKDNSAFNLNPLCF